MNEDMGNYKVRRKEEEIMNKRKYDKVVKLLNVLTCHIELGCIVCITISILFSLLYSEQLI